ncbi:alpha-xenorhabdolysin family binary toxin subunit A [Pseudomonas sp. Irchel 3H3]|uniref:alpha-xenorhabdolysin family binary toxin subunit A n=1 Tax=Pseudomonas sp. Irchel 3H3 TaxID=2009038 RepID=UPI000BA2EEF1|nr:alpha-xenorhabdolysin family binary toxin subunit A [Pseudomonas sp. Irchel 3H3]
MDDKILDAAVLAPKLFVDASVGDGEEYNREPGFQLTKEQIVSLRKYEVLGLSLPVEIDDVIVYLDYGQGDTGSPGLTARDFQMTFRKTYDHARSWSPLREKIMLTGTDLKIFAGSILRTGNGIVEIYEDQKISRYLEEHGIDTPERYLQQKIQNPELPTLDLSAGDLRDLRSYLDEMLNKVQRAHTEATLVRDGIDRFGSVMREEVLPSIKLRLKAVSENTYQSDIKELQQKIDERSEEIEEVSKQYDKMVQDAIMAAASLNIAGLVLGIYTGVKAEEIRKQRNALKEAQQHDNLQMLSKNKTLSSLNRIRTDLQELRDVTIEAEVATQNLMLVWNSLALYIEASKEDADLLDNALSLRQFKNQVLSIVEPWNQIKNSADQLLGVFAEADKEYESGQLLGIEGVRMFRSFAESDISIFNVVKLRAANAQIQDANIAAQMLFERWSYQKGSVEKIQGLALAANEATANLRVISNATIIHLQQSQKKLGGLQEEVESPIDADEVRTDMQNELKKLSGRLTGPFDELKRLNKKLLVSYSRDDSAQLAKEVHVERKYAEERQAVLEKQRDELEPKIKSVSDGIDLIAKAGIEKLGKQMELSKDKVMELGMTPPQVEVVMFAIDTLKNLIEDIGTTVSYLNMVAELNRLRVRLTELKDQARKCSSDVERADGQIELLQALDKVDEERSGYVAEFSALLVYFESLSRKFTENEAEPVEARVEFAIAEIKQDINYLKSLTL